MNEHQRHLSRKAGKSAGYSCMADGGIVEKVSRMARSPAEKRVDEEFREKLKPPTSQRPEMILGSQREERMEREARKALAPGMKRGGKVC